MTAATAATPQRFGLHTRGMAVGLALGLAALAFVALLPDAVAYIYLGAQLAGIGWVYFGFGVADGRPSAIAAQVLSAGVFLTIGFLGAYHESTVLLGVGFLAHGGWDWLHHNDHGPTHVRTWYPPFCVVADVVHRRAAARRLGAVDDVFDPDGDRPSTTCTSGSAIAAGARWPGSPSFRRKSGAVRPAA